MRFFFPSLVNSLYNVTWLKEKKDKLGSALGYFFLFLLLIAIISVSYIAISFGGEIGKFKNKVTEAIPEFTATFVSSSLVVTGPEQPFVYKSEKDEMVAILDTVTTTSLDVEDFITKPEQSVILVTKDKFQFYDGRKGETRTNFWRNISKNVEQKDENVTFNKTQTIELMNKITSGRYLALFFALMVVFYYIGIIISHLFVLLLVSLVVFIVAKIAKKSWRFGQVVAIGLYGITLPSLVVLVLGLFTSISYLYSLIYLAFLLAVVFTKSANDPSAESVSQNPV